MACAELADIVFYPLYAHEYKNHKIVFPARVASYIR